MDEILDRLHDTVRDIVAGERIESMAMPALGYEPSAGPWATAWPALEARIGAVFGDLPEVRIDVHMPKGRAGWPAGCPSATQLRAARMLCGLGVRELAKECAVSVSSIMNIENRASARPRERTLEALRGGLERHGAEFGAAGWVRHVDDEASAMATVADGAGPATEVIGASAREPEAWALSTACARALTHVEQARQVLLGVCRSARSARAGQLGSES